jgi:hypothetical protein
MKRSNSKSNKMLLGKDKYSQEMIDDVAARLIGFPEITKNLGYQF